MYATDWAETVAPDEDTRFAAFAEELRDLQKQRSAKQGNGRALHRKQHAGVAATITVRDDVPDALKVGPFASPRTYRAYVRFSNGGPRREPDGRPDIRGVALKILDVDGAKVLGDARTQDFLMIQRPAQPFATPDDFMKVVRAGPGNPSTFPLRVWAAFGPIGGVKVLGRLAKMLNPQVASYATQQWYTAVPQRWGSTAARCSLVPVDAPPGPPATGDDGYTADLARRLAAGPIRFDFAVQGYEDATRTPIEDASVDWPTPYVPVARLEIAQQDIAGEAGRQTAELVEQLSFDPWHSVVELRPLGAMMRARKHAYYASIQERAAQPDPA